MESLRYGTTLYHLSMNLSYPQGIGFVARPPFCKLIVSHIFSWTRDEVSAKHVFMLVASRDFSEEILARIRSRVKDDPMLTRTALSREVCAWMGWQGVDGRAQNNGRHGPTF